MRTMFLAVFAVGCLLLTGCSIGVPLWPLMLVEHPTSTATNTCPTPLTLPVADSHLVQQ
jgi:hypothetical protein